MCGIFGHLSLSSRDEIGSYVDDALDLLTHRGPDGRGAWRSEGIFLGSRRLSIIDLPRGGQPISNEDGTRTIVYNGEIYNFKELQTELSGKGHRFKTASDTEVVLHAYEEWGSKCLDRFNGMFAFAIWNSAERSLFLARDRLGEKPLYYWIDDDRLVFASEIKAILACPDVVPRVSHQGLVNFLSFGHALAPQTMFLGIQKLLPAHHLEAREGSIGVTEYWDVGSRGTSLPVDSREDACVAIRETLEESVRMRLVSDVPLGAFLSGGIDSSAVVAFMRMHTDEVNTFALGFGAGGQYDQLAEARTVAEHFGTKHEEFHIEHLDLIDTLRTLVYHYDEPFGDAAAFPLYTLSRLAAEHVKVVLVGDGGDELFGGYRRYAADLFSSRYRRLPAFFTNKIAPSLVEHLPRIRRLKRTVKTLPIAEPGRRYAGWLTVFDPQLRAELLADPPEPFDREVEPIDAYASYYDRLNANVATDHLNRLLYVDLNLLLPNAYLEKVDKATMAASLEARVPMLDPDLVELAFSIPGRWKVKGLSTKRILKYALKDVLPEWILSRPKRGFSVPTDPWFRGALKEFTFEVLLDDRSKRRGYFNSRLIERLWKEHVDGRHVWDHHLWLLLNFELWHRIFLDGETI